MGSTYRAVAQIELDPELEELLGTIPLKGALDAPIKATFFKDVQAFEHQERPISLRQLEHKIRETKAKHKGGLPLIKLATFGNTTKPKAEGKPGKCLRHDGNMLKVSGIEGDYDAGEMPMAQAAELLRQAGVAALLYTSTHHTPEAPRWRVLCPLAMEVTPEARAALCARLNGILGGTLGDESFKPSQPYYFGEAAMRDEKKGGGNAHPLETMLLEGKPLDQVKGPQIWACGSDKPAEDRVQNDDERAPLGVTAQRVAEWLEHLPNADVPYLSADEISWSRVMLAVRHECQGRPAQERAQFLEAFQNWSRKSEKHNDKEAAREWKKRSEGQGDVITARWLKGQAEAHGWIDENEFEDYGDEEVGLPIPAKNRGSGKAMRTESGKLIVNATNAIIVLGKEVESILPGLRRNLMTGTDEWSGGLVDDAAIMTTRVHLEQRGLPTIGKELVSDAITTVARAREAHPIRDWLKGLKHDGKPRLEAWLSRCLGAEDTPYSRGIGKAFLLSMVARVMQPGCKVDHALVLAGPQGIGKSTACRILSGDEYFSDSMPSVTGDSKEARQHLMGKWLVELSELAPARRSDAEDLKAFISGKVDKIRLPYGRRDQTIERQCVFIGTTNEDEFLNDPTGERRWWPVELSARIDLAALKADREQLFAEAVVAYDNREQWWLEPEFEREHAEPVRKLARVSDPWEELILSYVDGPEDDLGGGKPRTEVRAIDVLLNAIGLPEAQHTRATHKRVTDVLKRNGFERHHTRTGKVWRRDQ